MRPRVRASRSSLRILLVFTTSLALLPVAEIPLLVGGRAQVQRQDAARPTPGRPEGVFPNLEEVQDEWRLEREAPPPIPSTVRSPKLALKPWDGRRVGDPEPRMRTEQGSDQPLRAHARRRVRPAPPPVPDDQLVQNFFTWAVSRAANATEQTYWNDQLRLGMHRGRRR